MNGQNVVYRKRREKGIEGETNRFTSGYFSFYHTFLCLGFTVVTLLLELRACTHAHKTYVKRTGRSVIRLTDISFSWARLPFFGPASVRNVGNGNERH